MQIMSHHHHHDFETLAEAFAAAEAHMAQLEADNASEDLIDEAFERGVELRESLWACRPTTFAGVLLKLERAIEWSEEAVPEQHSPLRQVLSDLCAVIASVT